jgi:TM2 domain-containing membrane protein YozV
MNEQDPDDPNTSPDDPTLPQPYPPVPYPQQLPAQQQPPVPYSQGYPAQPPHQPASYPYPPVHVAPKNPALALLVSFFIPGVGTMMNGQVGKGIGILVGYLLSLLLTVVLIGFIGVVGFWVWGMVDAYNGAQKWNLRHGIAS